MFFRNANKVGTIYNRTTTRLLAASVYASFAIQATENPIEVIEVEQQKLHATGNYQKIDRQAILEIGQTAADVLKKINGIQIRSVAGLGNQTEVSVRGSTNKQVQVYIDGQLINDSQFGGFDLNQLPVEQIESIEVSKSQALGTGSTPIGGVIRINTFDPTKNQVRVSGGIGSFGYEQFSALVSHNVAGHQVSANVSYTYSDNDYEYLVLQPVEDPNTPKVQKSLNNQFKKISFYLNDSFVVGNHNLKASFQYDEQDKNEPHYQKNLSEKKTNLSSTTKRLSIRNNWLYGGDWLESIEFEGYYQTKDEVYNDRRLAHINNNYFYFDDKYAFNVTGQFNLSGFVSGLTAFPFIKTSRQEFESHSIRTDLQIVCNGIGACDVIAKQTQLDVGSRFEWVSSTNKTNVHLLFNQQSQKNSNQIKQPVAENTDYFSDKHRTPSSNTVELGAVNSSVSWLDTELVASLSLSKGTRVPTLFEQFGDRGLLKGNDNLKEEQARSINMSFEQTFSSFSWQSSIYKRKLQDAIVAVYNSSGVGSYENVSDATLTGLEAQLDWQLSDKLTAKLSTHIIDSNTKSPTPSLNDKKVPGIYHQQYLVGLNYDLLDSLKLSIESQLNEELYYKTNNLIATTPYFNPKGKPARQKTSDARLTWFKKGYSLVFSVKNLFDKQYLDLNNRPAEGRSFQLKFTIEDM